MSIHELIVDDILSWCVVIDVAAEGQKNMMIKFLKRVYNFIRDALAREI